MSDSEVDIGRRRRREGGEWSVIFVSPICFSHRQGTERMSPAHSPRDQGVRDDEEFGPRCHKGRKRRKGVRKERW